MLNSLKLIGTVDESKCIQIGRLLTDQKLQFLKEKEMMEQKRKERKKTTKNERIKRYFKRFKIIRSKY